MTMLLWRILTFHMAFLLLLSFVNCQFEDDALSPNLPVDYPDDFNSDDDNNHTDGDVDDVDDNDKDDKDYIDNRIDAKPTYISSVEKVIKAIIAPFGWISNAVGRNNNDAEAKSTSQTGVGKLVSGITRPIKNFVSPVGYRAVRRGFGEVLNMIGDRFKAIYPGTEWCGAGNIAKNPEEVGLFKKTDSCCRAHDQCNTNLDAGATEHGLRNNGIFTRSHCLCDANFYFCLKEARTLIAKNIGITYFNILRPQCFKEEYPAHCVRYEKVRLRNNKCLDYDYDYAQNKTWQWFDSPDFV